MEDTIVAISTVVGISALNVIKVSGSDSIKIVNKIFSKDLIKVSSHTIHYGFIVDNKERIDEVLVSVFKSPKSYTTEDIVEINCHGGIVTTNKILELLIKNGCRLAEPGEFLKRAFLNGRIDLIEAESVESLINAKTEEARKVSINGINGDVSKLIKDLREEILSLIANIEVNIDYPEYEDALVVTNNILRDRIKYIKERITEIINKSEDSKIILNGVRIGIIGSPNVGKSSLLNALLEEEKAIVTDIEGTTRDTVEGSIVLGGIELKLVDTAGIRDTNDIVEKIGVEKSIEISKSSDLILFVLDNNKKLTPEEKKLLSSIDKNKVIIVINKIDLKSNLELDDLKEYNIVQISLKNNVGITDLKELISKVLKVNEIKQSDYTYLTNARQLGLLKSTIGIIDDIGVALHKEMEVDLIEIDIRRLWETLGEITGETYKDELLDEIFSKFCLGK